MKKRITLLFFVLCTATLLLFSQDNLSLLSIKDTRPNILLIIADDLGFSDLGAYGGEIATPTIDKLAATGIQFSNFHTLASCSPTRSMLLTGTDNHIAGIGGQAITERQSQSLGYEGYLNQQVAALPEVLKSAGYRTYHVGKWHLGFTAGKRAHDRGFQESFALLPGGASHYADQIPLHPEEPVVYTRNGQVLEELPANFYSTKNYTDTVLSWLERDKQSGNPFFAQLAYTAPHDPLHAPRSYIEKYKGKYDEGYEVLREKRFLQLKKLGIIAPNHELPPFPKVVKKWTDLSAEEQRLKARDMETYAAMIDYLDEQINRVYEWLVTNDALDNTFIIFMSDNGANGMPRTFYPAFDEEFGSQFDDSFDNRGMPGSFTSIGAGWAIASSSAFRLFKHAFTEGGIRTPLIIKPNLSLSVARRFLSEKNIAQTRMSKLHEKRNTFIHVKDLMPTFLDLAKTTHPATTNKALKTMTGQSILPLLKGENYTSHLQKGIGYELHGNRAFFKGDWKLLQVPMPLGSGDWQLYNLKDDPAETNDLALTNAEKVTELVTAHAAYEKENGVVYDLPLFLADFRRNFQILLGLIVFLFGLAILGKLSGKLKNKYLNWGYGLTFMYGLAGVETITLVGLFTKYNQYAAWFLVAIMGGAFFTLIKNKEGWKSYIMPLLATVLLGLFLLFKSGRLFAAVL